MAREIPSDVVVFYALCIESVLLGHDDGYEGIKWAVEQGYIEILPDEPPDRNIKILDAGREHVAKMVAPVRRG